MLDELPFRLANGLCIPSSLYHHKRTRANDLQVKFCTRESEAMLKDLVGSKELFISFVTREQSATAEFGSERIVVYKW
jgi:hypothetical protein